MSATVPPGTMGRTRRPIEGNDRVIIFGFRTMVKLLAAVNLVCRNCHNPAAQRVFQQMRWFTLFFIPIFPVSKSRSMTCTFCGISTKLTKDEAEHLANGPGGAAQQPPAPQPQGWPQQGQPPHQQAWQQGPPPQQQGWQQGPPPQQQAPGQQGWPPPGQYRQQG